MVAICGVSGAGKSSLAIDTLYAEGQRRYVESFSPYTRQFLARLNKPDCDSISFLPPALAVTRSGTYRGNRTTVGTASETLEYLRILFAKLAQLNCHKCGRAIAAHAAESVAQCIGNLPARKLMIAFNIHWEDSVDRAMALSDLQAAGFVRLISNGRAINLSSSLREELTEYLPVQSSSLVIVDRIKGGEDSPRITESLESAFDHGNGNVDLLMEAASEPVEGWDDAHSIAVDGVVWLRRRFSRDLRCEHCNQDFPNSTSQVFNFNSPLGACSACEGFGDTVDFNIDRIVPDKQKSLRQGAIAPWNSPSYSSYLDDFLKVAKKLGVPVDVPFAQLTPTQVQAIWNGDANADVAGLTGFFSWLERKKYKMHVRVFLSRWRTYRQCPLCHGQRLNDTSLAYSLAGHNFAQLCDLRIDYLQQVLSSLEMSEFQRQIAHGVLAQTQQRLSCLQQVGLGYLALNRTLRTLSAGEAQRVLLTTALGSSLVHMLYVLDEPSAGLHAFDVAKLIIALRGLTHRGNTVVVVEHDATILSGADHLVEIGPQAGEMGGEVVCYGTLNDLKRHDRSLTGAYLSHRKRVSDNQYQRTPSEAVISLSGCSGNNLRALDVDFPLGLLCAVTGVSGSGKSSLVQETLFPAINNALGKPMMDCLPFESLRGWQQVEDCLMIDQSPVSRSPRSNPVTYIKAFDEIRQAFADTIDAKARNYSAGHFSFNSDLGRCPVCQGDGVLQIDMQFLADVSMTCTSCRGSRYRPEVLEIKYRDRNIAQVLQLTVREAQSFFRGTPKVSASLEVLVDVGLEYLQLGQSALTLSAGEAQRLKLAGCIAISKRPRTLFVFDEPATGLHPHDIAHLLRCFHRLIDSGHSVVIVEHNLHLIAAADYVIDLGPGAADLGGTIVATGSPPQLIKQPTSITGQYLANFLTKR